MYVTAGEAASIPIEFRIGGDLVVPDENSVTAQLRDQSGALVTGWDPKTLDPAGLNVMLVSVEAEANEATTREKRTLIVSYRAGGVPQKITTTYFVTPWINTTVTPEDVRIFFGVDAEELPDLFIQIEDAYYRAAATYGQTELDAVLVDPTTMQQGNDLIMALAARPLVPVLKVRLMQSESSDQEKYSRFSKLDLDSFYGKIDAIVVSAAADLFAETATSPTIFDVATPTDVITGV